MTTPLAQWKKTKRRNIPTLVGNFFQNLGSRILKASPPANGSLDLAIKQVLVGIEVKAGDYHHRLRIPTAQLRKHMHENMLLFPDMLENLVYCLFCYKNPKTEDRSGKQGKRSALSRCKDEYDVFSMLAKHTETLYIFDHRVILAIKDLFGTCKKKLPCDPEAEVIMIGKNYLLGFNEQGATAAFSSLGFKPSEWIIRERCAQVSMHIGLLEHILQLKIVEVMPQILMDRIDGIIKPPREGTATKRTLRWGKPVPATNT